MEELIRNLNSIYPMSSELQEGIALMLKEKTFLKKEYLLKAGQVCKNIYFIKKGLVRCFYNKGDSEVCSWFMKEGDFMISVESFFNQKESYENIQALEDCEVYTANYNDVQNLYNKFPEYNFVGRILTEKYYVLSEQRLYSLRMQRSFERYQYILENHSELINRVPSKYIASYLGVSEETLSRIRSGKILIYINLFFKKYIIILLYPTSTVMKPLLLPILIAFSIISCRKSIESNQNMSSYLNKVNSCLKDSLAVSDYDKIDLSKALITHPDSTNNFLRVPFKGMKISQRFVVLKTNPSGEILQGTIVEMKKDTMSINSNSFFNGIVSFKFLNGNLRISSSIKNGYITALHKNDASFRSLVVPTQAHVLPEVVVTCYPKSDGGLSYSDWVNISSLLGGGNDGYYSSLANYDAGGDWNGGGGVLNPGNGDGRYEGYQSQDDVNNHTPYNEEINEDKPILVDFELAEVITQIDIDAYLKCFSTIPDAGSTCSIEIFSDIPVDDHPELFFNWSTGSPGHTFLQITKTSGNQSVVQNVGFYPVQGWKTMATGPVEGMFVDNSNHEYNVGLKMFLSPEQLKNTLGRMSKLAHQVKYDIDEYNCTDFALDIFNSSRTANPIEIQKFHLLGSTAPDGSNTPQGLYKKLVQMKGVSAESPNITIPRMKQFVSKSNGPCN